MIQPDIRIYQERKQLMRNLKRKTGRTEKTKHFVHWHTQKQKDARRKRHICLPT